MPGAGLKISISFLFETYRFMPDYMCPALGSGPIFRHPQIFINYTTKNYHRITESFELEGTLKGHLVQLPCIEQGYLQLDEVAQSPSSLIFNVSKDRASTTFLGNCASTSPPFEELLH